MFRWTARAKVAALLSGGETRSRSPLGRGVKYHIDAAMVCDGVSFRFTGIYGEPCIEKRSKTWEVMRYLHAQDNLPWICAGDFNEALRHDEQQEVTRGVGRKWKCLKNA